MFVCLRCSSYFKYFFWTKCFHCASVCRVCHLQCLPWWNQLNLIAMSTTCWTWMGPWRRLVLSMSPQFWQTHGIEPSLELCLWRKTESCVCCRLGSICTFANLYGSSSQFICCCGAMRQNIWHLLLNAGGLTMYLQEWKPNRLLKRCLSPSQWAQLWSPWKSIK